MTPHEEAVLMVDAFRNLVDSDAEGYRGFIYSKEKETERAKLCALICVKKIKNAIDFDWMEVQNLDREHEYWDRVESEIKMIK